MEIHCSSLIGEPKTPISVLCSLQEMNVYDQKQLTTLAAGSQGSLFLLQ